MDKELPCFKYHPDPFINGVFRRLETPAACPCCGEETSVVYEGPFYSIDEVEGLCPGCIASGAAAERFDSRFQDSESMDKVSDPGKLEELVWRTPGYCGWRQEYWRAHCDDSCAFVGYIGYKELVELELLEEVLKDLGGSWCKDYIQDLTKDGSMQGYLFRCLHCSKYLLYVDCDQRRVLLCITLS